MKKITTIFLCLSFIHNSFGITIGEKYIVDSKIQNNTEKVILQNNNKLSFSTNKDGIVNKINYEGVSPLNLKTSLGKYYESYNLTWQKRTNKYNHTYAQTITENVEVNSFGIGGKVYKNEILLIKE